MGERVFLSDTSRYWRFIGKETEKHEFDAKYSMTVTSRTCHDEKNSFEYILEHDDCSVIGKDVLIRKISETSNLPERIINCVLLDMFDLMTLALQNDKRISLHSFGSFYKGNENVIFEPSRQLKRECFHENEQNSKTIAQSCLEQCINNGEKPNG